MIFLLGNNLVSFQFENLPKFFRLIQDNIFLALLNNVLFLVFLFLHSLYEHVEHNDTNSIFSHEQSVPGTCYQTANFLKITTWICLRRYATSTLIFLIFDVIGGLSNVSISPYLLICF